MAVILHLDSDGATPITGKTLPDIGAGAVDSGLESHVTSTIWT